MTLPTWYFPVSLATAGCTFFGDKSLNSRVLEQIVDNCCLDNAIVHRFTLKEQATYKIWPYMECCGQRVALARILMEDRSVIILDEPFSAPDARTRVDIQDLAVRHRVGRTVLLATHDPGEAVRLCNHIYLPQDNSLMKAKTRSGPFPKLVDSSDALALQEKLLLQIR